MAVRIGRRTSSFAVAGALGLALLSPLWGGQAGATTTATRYASPTGSGTSCTQSSPCDLISAVNDARGPTEVIIEPGQYGSPISPVAATIRTEAPNMEIHGQADKAAPVIFSSAGIGLLLTFGSTVDHISMIYTGPSVALSMATSAVADHVVVQSTGELACHVEQSSLYNSVCEDSAEEAVLTSADNTSSSSTLRNVTAIGTGSATRAVECSADHGGSCSMRLVNTIAVANTAANGADATANNQSTAVMTAFNSDFSGFGAPSDGTSTSSVSTDDTDFERPPIFVDQANGNFREAATSPTIDTGLTGGAEGSTDLGGLPRVLGSSADMGAYEFAPLPAVSNIQVTKRTKHRIYLTAVSATQGLPASVQVVAHHRNTSITDNPKAVAAHSQPKTVHLVAGQLRAHTKYKIEVTVTDAGGTASATSARVRTSG